MTDVDDFKTINDQYGHTTDDSVMATIATIFKQTLPESACTVRFGGDEFMIMLLANAENAKAYAELVRRSIERETSLLAFKNQVTMSFGISELMPMTAYKMHSPEPTKHCIAQSTPGEIKSRHSKMKARWVVSSSKHRLKRITER